MRIGGGRLRGRQLRAPRGAGTRPSSGRIKKSLFDILAPRLSGASLLDLFAGAGAVGIEALSRGARCVTFVESRRQAVRAIEGNLEALGLASAAEIVAADALTGLARLERRGASFDLAFLDPPYGRKTPGLFLSRLASSPLLAEGGLAVLEHHHKTPLEPFLGRLRLVRQVKVGESCLSFFEESTISWRREV